MTYSYTQISQYLTCPRRYRHRYLDGWKEKDTRAAMLFGRAFEQALGAYFRREDPGALLFSEWSQCQSQGLHYSNGDSWDRMLRQGIMLLTRFCQDDRIQVAQPRRNLQIKFTRPIAGSNDFVCLCRCRRQTRRHALLARVENLFEPIPCRARRAALPGPAAGLLLVDDGHCRCRPGRIRSQTACGGSVPANHDHRRAAARVWRPGGKHSPSYRVGGLSAAQRHPLSAESVQQLSLRGALSWKPANGRRQLGAASRSRQS